MQLKSQTCAEFIEDILNGLKQRNLDINKKVSLSFYCEHKNDNHAMAMSRELAREGFDTDVDAFQQHMNKWRCWANISVVPNTLNLQWIATSLMEKSVRYEGEIAGWETNPYESGQELGQMMAQFENTWQEAV